MKRHGYIGVVSPSLAPRSLPVAASLKHVTCCRQLSVIEDAKWNLQGARRSLSVVSFRSTRSLLPLTGYRCRFSVMASAKLEPPPPPPLSNLIIPSKMQVPSILDSPELESRDDNIFIADEQPICESPPPPSSQMYLVGIGLVNLITFLYSTNFAIVKDMETSISPSMSSVIRFGLAAVFFLPFLRNAEKGLLMAGAEMGFWLWGGYVSQACGLQYTDANKSSFIAALTVVCVPLLEWVLFKRKISSRHWVAAVLAVAGVGLLESGGVVGAGDLWSLGMPICWSMAFIRLEKYSSLYPSLPLTGAQLVTVASLSAIWAAFEHPVLNVSTIPWIEIFYTGVVTTALTVWLETIALKYVTAVETTVWFTLEPVWAAVFSYVFLHEQLGPQGAAGSGLILAACACSQIRGVGKKFRSIFGMTEKSD
mmetsp:Transcript_21748/g.35969  ORF Transcript_21748/g.35969 Transcript_21748/m.35969 type:complete len:423 (-) Transcript_21748:448-1716(-)